MDDFQHLMNENTFVDVETAITGNAAQMPAAENGWGWQQGGQYTDAPQIPLPPPPSTNNYPEFDAQAWVENLATDNPLAPLHQAFMQQWQMAPQLPHMPQQTLPDMPGDVPAYNYMLPQLGTELLPPPPPLPQYPQGYNMLEYTPTYNTAPYHQPQDDMLQPTQTENPALGYQQGYNMLEATPGYNLGYNMQTAAEAATTPFPGLDPSMDDPLLLAQPLAPAPAVVPTQAPFPVPNVEIQDNFIPVQNVAPQPPAPSPPAEAGAQRGARTKRPKALQQCPDCGYSTRNNEEFRRHRESKHRGLRRHRCDICNAGYNDPSGLTKHKKSSKHIEKAKELGIAIGTSQPYACRFCVKTRGRSPKFCRGDQLARHLRSCKNCTRKADGLPDGYEQGTDGMKNGRLRDEPGFVFAEPEVVPPTHPAATGAAAAPVPAPAPQAGDFLFGNN